MHTR